MGKLSGKVALVTGGSRGIGRGICHELAKEGAIVAVNYTSHEDEAAEAANGIINGGGLAKVYRGDVSKKADMTGMIEQIVQDFGKIDVLVNNAGICPFLDFFDIDEETWNKTIGINLSGMFYTSQAAARHMREQGKGVIVNISTVSSYRGGHQQVHYISSKGGVNSLTTSMANELAKHNIRVNGILCGGVPTDINVVQFDHSKVDEIYNAPGVRRLGKPEDLGKAVVYLASDDSEWVTGTLMAVDGGYMVT